MLKLLKPKKGNNFNRAVNVNEGGWMRERVNGVYIKSTNDKPNTYSSRWLFCDGRSFPRVATTCGTISLMNVEKKHVEKKQVIETECVNAATSCAVVWRVVFGRVCVSLTEGSKGLSFVGNKRREQGGGYAAVLIIRSC